MCYSISHSANTSCRSHVSEWDLHGRHSSWHPVHTIHILVSSYLLTTYSSPTYYIWAICAYYLPLNDWKYIQMFCVGSIRLRVGRFSWKKWRLEFCTLIKTHAWSGVISEHHLVSWASSHRFMKVLSTIVSCPARLITPWGGMGIPVL